MQIHTKLNRTARANTLHITKGTVIPMRTAEAPIYKQINKLIIIPNYIPVCGKVDGEITITAGDVVEDMGTVDGNGTVTVVNSIVVALVVILLAAVVLVVLVILLLVVTIVGRAVILHWLLSNII